jgi:hypothetical protein
MDPHHSGSLRRLPFRLSFAGLLLCASCSGSLDESFTWGPSAVHSGPWGIELGGSGSDGGISATPDSFFEPNDWHMGGPALVVDNGMPVVAWAEYTSSGHAIWVRRWTGSFWSGLDTTSDNGLGIGGAECHNPAAATRAGVLCFAWETSSQDIHLKTFVSGAWQELDGSATGGGVSDTPSWPSGKPSVACDPAGRLYVAWSEHTGMNWAIYLKVFVPGSGWTELAGSATGGGVSNNTMDARCPAVAVDPFMSRPVVAWYNASGSWDFVYLKKWNGSAWEELGGSATGGGVSGIEAVAMGCSPGLQVRADGNPMVAWTDWETSGANNVYFRMWDGMQWIEPGGSAQGAGLKIGMGQAGCPALALGDMENPVVVYQQPVSMADEVLLRRWDGATWTDIAGSSLYGGVSRTMSPSQMPAVVYDGTSGAVFVAWTEWRDDGGSPNREIYLRRSP